ncbi:unnamed protein product [Rotaria sp. Silwood1]|nr:unnamed protein product [Rotaria sp. Silwood1]
MWHKKKDKSTIKLPLITRLPSPRIEELENEFMNVLKNMYNNSETSNYEKRKYTTVVDLFNLNNTLKETIEECNQYQTMFHASKRLLLTRSVDDFANISIKPYLYSSLSSQFIYQSCLKNKVRRSNYSDKSLTNISKCQIREITDSSIKLLLELTNTSKTYNKSELCLKKENSPINHKLSLHWDESSLKLTSKHDQQQESAAIIEIEHQSYSSISSSSIDFSKPLEKSYSSPLPMNTNHLSSNNKNIQSAHLIDQYQYENKNRISLYSCISEMENDESTKTISSDDENVKHNLFQYQDTINKKNIRHRWSLFDIWETTIAKLPPILNCIWRQRLYRTGSREFLLEYDQTLPTNNNNHRTNIMHEQRYVEQERPINTHFGVALLALLIFPPVGILAIILSIWSLCGKQDRHLSRKFGNAAYWISILAICFSFLLLFTLFTYFTYQYLINRPIIINHYYTTPWTRHSLTKDIDYV